MRDYVYVSDVVEAMMKAVEYPGEERLFNVGSGVGHTLNDVVQVIEQVLGRKVEISYASARSVDVPVNVLDISKARRTLDWNPIVSFEAGIERSIIAIKELQS